MNRFKYSKKIFGVLAVLLVICATFFPRMAIADSQTAPFKSDCTVVGDVRIIPDPNDPNEIDVIPPTVIVNNADGCSFSANAMKLSQALRVERAIIELPEGVTGVVKSLQISKVDNEGNKAVIYGCSNLKVQDGTDLNVSCGGPSYLPANQSLEYNATIADFEPGTKFAITLVASQSKQLGLQ
ncbi:MAG: hypothetical protein RM049_12085 [Nostoc sp. DedQUE04]|uniref:hypothetical protein n=1 Tax=Nostoc sp. DedQUE04 TaxID=3075390 RepID=UPI002AD38B5A|nr:hypothetical protein [Nostoc sp. DedQUE04]MDZ8136024.1 hypothetical protein [Nostoc sp. DedQUE04]